jgi:hypothetical protein
MSVCLNSILGGFGKDESMKRFAVVLLGMAMIGSATGCYCNQGGCYWPNPLGGGYGYGSGYGYGGGYYGGGNCPGGNCGVQPGGVPLGVIPQGAIQNYNFVQAGYPVTIPGPVAFGSVVQPVKVIQTAAAPLEPLPTY